MILCENCGAYNDTGNKFCVACGVSLTAPVSELDIIRREIIAIKQEYESKISNLLARIESYEKESKEIGIEPEKQKFEPIPEVIQDTIKDIEIEPKNIPEEILTAQHEEIQPVSFYEQKTEETIHDEKVRESVQSTQLKPKRETPKKSLKEIVKTTPVIATLLEEIASPVESMWEYAQKTYNTYKAKNQLPVFFMTLAGIGALLFGFGYLMQLSIGYFGKLSEIIKIIFGFICSSGIALWATRLYTKGDKYGDFSSALMGLAVALNYLFIYFLSEIPDSSHLFASPILGFGLIIANTVFAIYFALKYETKIIAVLSLLGGAFAPFYLNSSESSPLYFMYLYLLCTSSIIVAHKIRWNTLGVLSFITSASIIGLAVFDSTDTYAVWIYAAIFHAFAYLYIWFSLFNGKRIAAELNKKGILLLAANMSLFLFHLYYLFADNLSYTSLGFVYAANALVFFPGIWLVYRVMSKQMRLLIFVLAGTFIAFAIPALFDKHLMGFFWSVEALALLFLGYVFSLPTVRKEAYILLLIALGKTAFTFQNLWFFTNQGTLLSSGYYNLLSLGIIFAIIIILQRNFGKQNLSFENHYLKIFKNIISFWFLVSYSLTIAYFTTDWFSYATSIVSLAIIAIGFKENLTFTKIIGYIGLIACIADAFVFGLFKIILKWDYTIFHSGYANLVGVGLFLIALLFLSQWLNKQETIHLNIKAHTIRISNFISIWFSICYIVSGLYFFEEYTVNIAIIPMFMLIYIGQKKKFRFTEYLGLAYGLIILSGFMIPAIDKQTLRFSMLPVAAKIAILEFLFCMWFLKMFYDKYLNGNNKSKAMDVVREMFYWIVPLLILSPVYRHLPEFFPAALWVSVLISFLLYESTQRVSLGHEMHILIIAAILTGLLTEFYYYSIPASVAVLTYISIRKGFFNLKKSDFKDFRGISTGLPYFIGTAIFVSVYRVVDNPSYALIACSLYLSAITFFREKIAPIQNSYHIAYILSFAVTAIAILTNIHASQDIDKAALFVPIAFLGIIQYGKKTIIARDKGNVWISTIIMLHIMLLVSYSMLLNQTWLTVGFIVHAIAILFSSMKKHCKPLIWQSIAVFGIALIKLFFKDMADFTMVQKVIVFVIIGVLLLGASFLYVKIRNRLDENG